MKQKWIQEPGSRFWLGLKLILNSGQSRENRVHMKIDITSEGSKVTGLFLSIHCDYFGDWIKIQCDNSMISIERSHLMISALQYALDIVPNIEAYKAYFDDAEIQVLLKTPKVIEPID